MSKLKARRRYNSKEAFDVGATYVLFDMAVDFFSSMFRPEPEPEPDPEDLS